jgi:hypothetical protein
MKTRNVIENVPKVAFAPIHDGKWEFTPFPSCLKAVLGSMKESYPYHYLLATSGAAFRLLWHSKKWEGGNVDIVFMTEDPLEPFRRALGAAGRNFEILLNGTDHWNEPSLPAAVRQRYLAESFVDEAVIRTKLIDSIDKGRPVVGLGVVGPPEACIITGYDDGGDVLVGWSMFQEHMNPEHDIKDDDMCAPVGVEESGYFRQTDWFSKLAGAIILGEKAPYDESVIYHDTLELIPRIIKTPMVNEFYSGQRAYEEYIAKMLSDDEFDTDDMGVLSEKKLVHYDAMTMISERGGGAQFLQDAADRPELEPAASLLRRAAEAFKLSASQMEGWWKVVGQIWADEVAQVRATADAAMRRAFVPYIQKSKEKDLEAAELIEEALERLHGG